ncbi:MAG TPA: 23S rRNA (guanine(2445)-N(2))/(guanine(2069)-N(7))-methyltransferase, partial [Psychrobacter sp.]|nr:23S rRNA (guanine(2445)-N(2))/(guanine(2069)-N(7))-methyltransferase [Psychrobacter sp.]
IAAGLQDLLPLLDLETRALNQLSHVLKPLADDGRLSNPLVITNPPYGERLGDEEMIKPLYQALGLILQDSFAGSGVNPMLGILAANVEQVDILPIKEPKTLRCHNGAITVYFRYGTLIAGQTGSLISRFEKREIAVEEGQDFINRLQKNLGKLKRLASKDTVSNIRV